MTIRKFNEYMNSKGTVVKPKVDASGDNVDMPKDKSTTPPKSEKTMKTTEEGGKVKKEMTSSHKPYTAKGHKTLEKWDNVNPELKYEPDTATEMSIADFAKQVNEKYAISEEAWAKAPTISTPHGNFVPVPLEALAVARFLILNNEHFMESFVRDIKRKDGLELLVKELLKHAESYTEIADLMNKDEAVSNKLVRSLRLSEMVSVPKHKQIPDDFNLDDEDGDEDMGDEEDEEGLDMDDMGDDEDQDDMGDEDEMGGDDMDDEMGGGPDMGDDMGMGGPGGPMGKPMRPKMKPHSKMGMHFLKKAMGMM